MASLPTPIASNANGAPVATRASVRSSMNVGALEFTMCLAPMAFRTSTCSCLRTMFTSPMPGEELVNATVVAGGVEEERRPDRSALAARAVGVGRVGRTARGDRGAERVLDDAEVGVQDAGRRVELEDRGAGPTLEVADEGHLRL